MVSAGSERLDADDFKKSMKYISKTSVIMNNIPPENTTADDVKKNNDFDLGKTLSGARDETEKRIILEALKDSGNNKTKAAKKLNISRTLLYKKLAKHKIL